MAWIETSTGVALPTPQYDSGKVSISTLVDGGRNVNGDFIGSVIGNDKLKIECNFAALTPEQMMNWLRIFDRSQGGAFVNTFRVFDPRYNDYVLKRMYIGDRSGTPFILNPTTQKPTYWVNVSGNLIEV